MKILLLAGLAGAIPILTWAQEPPRAPITATPLMPPTVLYPPKTPPSGQPQQVPSSTPQGTMQQPTVAGPPSQVQQAPGQAQPAITQLPPGQTPAVPQTPLGQPAQGQAAQGQAAPGQPAQGQPPANGQTTNAPLPSQPAAPGQPSATGQPAGPEPAPPPPNTWLPRGGAVLQALDKINAIVQTLTVKDGQTVTFGSLSITVRACLVRPPDMPADAAAFLVITDSHPDQPGFRGWMVESDPSLSMLEHPLYNVRVEGCTP